MPTRSNNPNYSVIHENLQRECDWYHDYLLRAIVKELKIDSKSEALELVKKIAREDGFRDIYIEIKNSKLPIADYFKTKNITDESTAITNIHKIDMSYLFEHLILASKSLKLEKAIDKYIRLCECKSQLKGFNSEETAEENVRNFIKKFNEMKKTFSEPRDSAAWHHIKNMCLIVSSLVGNLGLIKPKFSIFARGQQFNDNINSSISYCKTNR